MNLFILILKLQVQLINCSGYEIDIIVWKDQHPIVQQVLKPEQKLQLYTTSDLLVQWRFHVQCPLSEKYFQGSEKVNQFGFVERLISSHEILFGNQTFIFRKPIFNCKRT